MTTEEEAYRSIMNALHKEQRYETPSAVSFIIDKLIAYGIHPYEIKLAFTTKAIAR